MGTVPDEDRIDRKTLTGDFFPLAWLRARGKLAPDAFLTFDDVACMMVGLKLARLANDPKHVDSAVDACGYLYLMDRINSEP